MTDHNPDGDDHQGSPPQSADVVQPQMTMHPITYSSMPMHMYPFPPGVLPAAAPRTKRRQVKNACTNCQKACKKCDDARPCLRCVKYGIAEECIDSQRKERQKGVKRGPYKKRDGKSNSVDETIDANGQPGMVIPPAVAATSATPPIPYVAPYAPFYGQYPTHLHKPGEGPVYVPQLVYAPLPPPHPQPMPGHGGQEGEAPGYPPPPYYPIFTPYPPQYATPYMVPAPRPPEGQPIPVPGMHPGHHYQPYPPPHMYQKPPSRGPDMHVAAQHPMVDPRRDMRYDGRMPEALHHGHGK
ncbi:uncharacterized protein C8Q71DRAFT_734966 [Rhodofomes roseus]|uniref:Transcription activator of gluconeogenesis ERT1 n=1 Tax=Rhodofomes roseus TaxID=34475 RepID=A0A4Y9XTH1_9APHY|nr:uncharacterized protein C8Q71DRAFT_734966 [Rhodofomes roseus]KAH9842884.1 hypothetical protein C8Q71DRAFT_734966 [Rhodofomes roseus]TFY51849.1 hypothetical protein EVJ58_g10345 [Rhodofomes roseus]